jgi:chorismate dehydratase
MLNIADAALLIGDDALIANSGRNRIVCDLGEEWRATTGKKMVYALWIIRRKFAEENPEQLESFYKKLWDSREYAYRNIDAISQELASRISISPEVMREHLLKLDYGFDRRSEEGLKEYFKYAKKFGIIKEMPRLKFFRV